jgi:molybdopterin synthase catalytic subunit
MDKAGGFGRLIRVQAEDFDPGAEAAWLTRGRSDVGALVTFVGLCRDEDGALAALEIEHYAAMGERELARVADEAAFRWRLLGLVAIHRYGLIEAGGRIVFVAAAAVHRRAAFAAADFLMDYLKTRAPFWKRAHLSDGTTGDWVEPRREDDEAAARWRKTEPQQ